MSWRDGIHPAPPAPAPGPGERARTWIRGALVDNLGLKFVSMVLALTVFILVNTGQDREIVARVGVSYSALPDDKVLVSNKLDAVRITVRGPWNRIRHFDERELDRIDLDLSHAQDGELAITPDMIKLPAGLTLTSISPRVVKVAFERVATKVVPIEPVYGGRPPKGYRVDDADTRKALPGVTVRGPAGLVGALTAIRTQEIRLDKHDETFSADVALVAADKLDLSPDHVTVSVVIEEVPTIKSVGPIAVKVTGDADPAKLALEPAAVEVELQGTENTVDQAIKAGLAPVIMVNAADAGKPHAAPVVMESLPPRLTYRIVPSQIMVSPKR